MLDECSCYLNVERNKIHRNKWKRDSRKKAAFQSKTIGQVLAPKEKKPPYPIKCYLCNACVLRRVYTTRHLHQRISEQILSNPTRGLCTNEICFKSKHSFYYSEEMQIEVWLCIFWGATTLLRNRTLCKQNKTKKKIQKDSNRAKLFTWFFAFEYLLYYFSSVFSICIP